MKNSKSVSIRGLLVTMLVIGNIIFLRTAFVAGTPMVQGVSAYYFISCACSHFQLVLEIDEALEVNFISQ
jgi:hypothetical protein